VITRISVVVLLGCMLLTAGACGSRSDDLSRADAAQALRRAPDFAVRQGSLVGRQLVEVLAVRRIGRESSEVEFTWRDTPLPPGQPSPLRTSMALFRIQEDGAWMLTSLYKVE
jgi:hypothetical protein